MRGSNPLILTKFGEQGLFLMLGATKSNLFTFVALQCEFLSNSVEQFVFICSQEIQLCDSPEEIHLLQVRRTHSWVSLNSFIYRQSKEREMPGRFWEEKSRVQRVGSGVDVRETAVRLFARVHGFQTSSGALPASNSVGTEKRSGPNGATADTGYSDAMCAV
jgi:hypothetical protein